MPLSRLAALFRRYAQAHLRLTLPGLPLQDEAGRMIGQLDRLRIAGGRLIAEGWSAAPAICLAQGAARAECTPTLLRRDVSLAHPGLANRAPGFAVDLPFAGGPATLALTHPGSRIVYQLPAVPRLVLRRAQAALLPAFLRDLARAAPDLVRWALTPSPAHRTRVKERLRLTGTEPARGLQRLLFLDDCLADLPEDMRQTERLRLFPPAHARHPITVILPVYNAFDLLPEALDRVQRHTDLPWHLILVEDASSDPAVRPWLRDWTATQNAAHDGRVTLIENAQNAGFIGAVNAGLAQAIARGHDVVLLNSDAFVPEGWASRLMRPFRVHDRVATVTPMSNDAEILTLPVICRRRDLAPGEADRLDAIARRIHPDAGLADAPTGVGFCMAMGIDWLRRLPRLDPAFGRGYGEEVDWCRRASALGGRHLATASLFVEHRGASSFGSAEKQRLIRANNALVSRRHPGFDAEVQAFLRTDPLVTPRLALGIAKVAGAAKGRLPVYLAHSLGGGAEDWLRGRIRADLDADAAGAALVLRVGGTLRWQVELHLPEGVTRGATDDTAFVHRLLDPVARRDIVYSCGVGDPDPLQIPSLLHALARSPGDRIEVLFHDYLPISPSYTLIDADGRYHGLPDPLARDAAHRQRRPDGTVTALDAWQRAWGGLLAKADAITVFSQDSRRLVLGAYPQAARRLRLVPHRMLDEVARCLPPSGTKPVIGILGNIGRQKGAGVLAALSRRLAETGAADLVLIGNLDPAYRLAAGAQVHGSYRRADIAALVARYGIDRWLIPSIWPETFSFTTREAIATGLPVWCFDLGAQAEAVRAARHATGLGGTLALADGTPDLDALLAALLADPATPPATPLAANPATSPVSTAPATLAATSAATLAANAATPTAASHAPTPAMPPATLPAATPRHAAESAAEGRAVA